MSQQSESQDQSFQVQLAIYDLSHGMASTLSLSLLGPDHSIPIVPHTGILIYGREYYFGGNGIESSDPHHFRSTRGLNPLEVKHLGTTNVSRSQFEDWCRSHRIGGSNGLYSPTSYDLFSRNCNNFSQHAVKEGLLLEGNDSHVPQWILDVPNRVLASPMGQMIRPMMEQMQVRGPSGDGANSTSFSGTVAHHTNGNGNTNRNHSTSASAASAVAISAAVNPWADMPSSRVITEENASATKGDASSLATPSQAPIPAPSTTAKTKYSRLEEKRIVQVLSFLNANRTQYQY